MLRYGLAVPVLLCFVASFASSAASAGDVPVSQWTVRGSGARDCTATAEYESFPSRANSSVWTLTVRSNGPATLHMAVSGSVAPEWRHFDARPSTERSRSRKAWFDRQAPFNIVLRDRGWLYTAIDFSSTNQLLEALGHSRRLTVELEPSRQVVGRYGQQTSRPAETVDYLIAGGDVLTTDLRACLDALRERRPYAGRSDVAQRRHDDKRATLAKRLRDAEAAVQARTGPDVQIGMLRIALGLLQMDAHDYGRAAESLGTGLLLVGGRNEQGSDPVRARTALVIALLHLEELDRAETEARKLPDPSPWLASLDVRRGDLEPGQARFLRLISSIAGEAFERKDDLGEWLYFTRAMDFPAGKLAGIRALLLQWAEAALGQEEWTSSDVTWPVGADTSLYLAAQLASLASFSVDPLMMLDAASFADHRTEELATAAYLRAEGLRRSGRLATVGSDLKVASFELGHTSNEALRARIRLASIKLDADRGKDEARLLGNAQETARLFRDAFGSTSFLYLEMASVVADLQLRLGDWSAARKTAAESATLAERYLSKAHSLVLRHRLLEAKALAGEKGFSAAGKVVLQAINAGSFGVIASEVETFLGTKKTYADASKDLSEIERLLGVPAATQVRPVTQRIQRLHLERFLRRLLQSSDLSEDRTVLRGALAYLTQSSSVEAQQGRPINRLEAPSPVAGENLTDRLASLQAYPADLTVTGLGRIKLEQYAAQWYVPEVLVPEDFRPTVRAGEDMQALETLLGGLHREFGQTRDHRVFDLALRLAAVTLQSGASASAYTRLLAGRPGEGGGPIGERSKAATAMSAAFFVRRLRAAMDQQIGKETDVGEALSSRILVRRLYGRILSFTEDARNQVNLAFNSGPSTSFHSMNKLYNRYKVSVASLQNPLASDEAVVIWLPLETSTFVLVVKKDALAWRKIPVGRRALRTLITRVKSSVEDAVGQRIPKLADFASKEAYELFNILFGAATPDLTGTKHIFTVQLGVTGALPLHLLRTGTGDVPPSWLSDRFAVTRMPALINPALHQRHSTAHPRKSVLAIGAPRETGAFGLRKLNFAEGEMQQVARIMQTPGRPSRILQGRDATRSNVVRELENGSYDIVMFATHGLVGGEDVSIGEPSLLLTWPAKRTWFDDGLLHTSEIAGLDIDARLVILSACSTALSGDDEGEPLTGLVSAFMSAGARTVLASYWILDDGAADDLTTTLVRAWGRNNVGIEKALTQSMAKLRGNRGHPVHWAPFEVIGVPVAAAAPAETDRLKVDPAPRASKAPKAPSASNTQPVPLDGKTSRLITEGFAALESGRCDAAKSNIEQLVKLWPSRETLSARRPTATENQIMDATAALVLAHRGCDMPRDTGRRSGN